MLRARVCVRAGSWTWPHRVPALDLTVIPFCDSLLWVLPVAPSVTTQDKVRAKRQQSASGRAPSSDGPAPAVSPPFSRGRTSSRRATDGSQSPSQSQSRSHSQSQSQSQSRSRPRSLDRATGSRIPRSVSAGRRSSGAVTRNDDSDERVRFGWRPQQQQLQQDGDWDTAGDVLAQRHVLQRGFDTDDRGRVEDVDAGYAGHHSLVCCCKPTLLMCGGHVCWFAAMRAPCQQSSVY